MMLLIALALVLAGYTIEQNLYKKNWDKGLEVRLQFASKSIAVGETSHIKEVVSNEKVMPIPSLELKFSAPSAFTFENLKNASKTDRYYCRNLFSVSGNQRIKRQLEFKATKRGYYTIKSIDVLTKDYFMIRRHVKSVSNFAEILVYPDKVDTSFFNPVYKSMMGEILVRQRIDVDPFMFRGIREYRTSDSMKFVNWKHSAQTGELMVNTYGSTANYRVCIILDGYVASVMDKEYISEKLISVASSIACRFINAGMPVAICSNWKYKRLGDENAKEVRTPMGYGRSQQEAIDYQLALIDTSIPVKPCDYMLDEMIDDGGSDKLYLVISANRFVDLKRLLDSRKSKGVSIYGLLAYTRREYDIIMYGDDRATDPNICCMEVNL